VTDIVLELQESLRSELKSPLGPIFTEVDDLLDAATPPIICIGDVVTYHLIEAGHTPAVALIDDRTERSDVDDEIAEAITAHDGFERTCSVENPQGTLSAELLDALGVAIESGQTTLIEVDGEEDLATLPAVVQVPLGASIVYGQPGEGMVLGTVDEDLQAEIRALLSRMEGDTERLWRILDG
jgi:uncharacterized protein (UPF0218 family)